MKCEKNKKNTINTSSRELVKTIVYIREQNSKSMVYPTDQLTLSPPSLKWTLPYMKLNVAIISIMPRGQKSKTKWQTA